MIVCEKCGGAESTVVNNSHVGKVMRRRRCCRKCGHRWNTVEISRKSIGDLITALKSLDPRTGKY